MGQHIGRPKALELTCVECGETKKSTRFPKKRTQYKADDPRRYARMCKRCNKPAKPGQSREEVKEPRNPRMVREHLKGRGKKKNKKRDPKQTQNEYKKQVREETRIQSMLYLAENGCEECGERDPRKLEYDHKDTGAKDTTIGRLIICGYSWTAPKLVAEIAKCRVLCANCHRKHTIEQQGYYSSDEVQRTLGTLAGRYGFDL